MQATKLSGRFSNVNRASLGRRLAVLFCVIASAIGWAAIIGLIFLLKPDLPF
jgi:hypothetical protein